MNGPTLEQNAWTLLLNARKLCKALIWLHDKDSPIRLTPKFQGPLKEALNTIVAIDGAIPALGKKLVEIYKRAVAAPWVGISGAGTSGRLGRRTAQTGLLAVVEEAENNLPNFERSVNRVCTSGTATTWEDLFDLTREFIHALDWEEFVLENPRGQAANLVLECTELLEALMRPDSDPERQDQHVQEELGDVFYNLMAFSLSVRIEAKNLRLSMANAADA